MIVSSVGRFGEPGLARFGLLTAVVLGVGLPPAVPSAARAEPTVLFVLDASGSMWGRIEGDVSQMEAAREAMHGRPVARAAA